MPLTDEQPHGRFECVRDLLRPVRWEIASKRDGQARTTLVWFWRIYAAVSLLFIADGVDRLVGPNAEPAFERFHGADFGAFYTGAVMVAEGRSRELGSLEAQREVQQAIQDRENTRWHWFDPLPHPPALTLLTFPMAALPLRTAYWLWVAGSLVAAGLAAWLLAAALAPRAPIATTIILLGFEPLWHLVWWGQVDAFLLLPFAAGVAMLLRYRSNRDDLVAGMLMGVLAIIPQFVPLPFLALAWSRRRAALGMAVTGATLALASIIALGRQGLGEYLDLSRRFGAFTGTPSVTERAMFNVRGIFMRLGLDLGERAGLVIVAIVSLTLAAIVVVLSGRALRTGRAPDLALGLLTLGMLLTGYHTHRQTMVFLYVLLAAAIGRSLRPGVDPLVAWLWALPVVALHTTDAVLRHTLPNSRYPIQTYLAPACLVWLILLAGVLGWPRRANALDGRPSAAAMSKSTTPQRTQTRRDRISRMRGV